MGSTSPSHANFSLTESSNANFGRTAGWDQADGSLVIKVLHDTAAGDLYKVAVKLKNQCRKQDPQAVSIISNGVFIDWKQAKGDAEKVPEKVMSQLCRWKKLEDATPCGKGDAMPMKIYDPEFIVSSVEQSTKWPGATNELTVELVANMDLTGGLHSNLTVSKMVSLHDKMPTAPFIVGEVQKGAYCDQDCNTASNLFVMFSVQNVRERFGTMNSKSADNFVCVRVEYTFDNSTYREVLTTEMGRIKPTTPQPPLNCSANGTWFNQTNSQTINCTLFNLQLPKPTAPVHYNCSLGTNETASARSFEHFCFCSPGKNGTWLNTTSNMILNCTPPILPWNQSVLTNSSEWFMAETEWQYYDGESWKAMMPVPTDLLVANVSKGVRSMKPSDDDKRIARIAGVAVGFVEQRSDIIFTCGKDKNIIINGDFLTPPRVAVTSKAGSLQTLICKSSSGQAPSCSSQFQCIGYSAKISVEVLNIDFDATTEHVAVSAGNVSLGAEFLKNNGLDGKCKQWTKILDQVAVPKGSLVNFNKFERCGQLEIKLKTSPAVGSPSCDVAGKSFTLYARVTLDTPGWDLFGRQSEHEDRRWNKWPLDAPTPAGAPPWIEPGDTNLIGSGEFFTASTGVLEERVLGNRLKLEMRKGKSLLLGERLSFSFFALNSLKPYNPYGIFLRSDGEAANIAPVTPMLGKLEVEAPAFIQALVVQSSPFPCSFNTITVALKTNVRSPFLFPCASCCRWLCFSYLYVLSAHDVPSVFLCVICTVSAGASSRCGFFENVYDCLGWCVCH